MKFDEVEQPSDGLGPLYNAQSCRESKQDFESSRNKIRTAPLWGVRLRPRLMLDGASLTLLEAITRHRGEATHVIQQFEKLKVPDQEAVIEFLKSL